MGALTELYYSKDLDFGTGEWNISTWVNIPVANSNTSIILSRAASTGPYIVVGLNSANNIYSTVSDSSNTRTVTTSSAYNTGTWTKVESNYKSGRLSLVVNGTEVANTNGSPLATLNNANAVFTIGNSFTLDAPFPGSIALLKASATVPTAEQTTWMYEQEKQLFANNTQCVLPASTNVLDLAYDDKTDTLVATQAGYESTWSGLVRTANTAVPAGSFSKTTAASGIKLSARTTTNPGVDVSISKLNLVDVVKPLTQDKQLVVFDFDGTASQTEFKLPVGYTTKSVFVNGTEKREGATKDYTLLYDGFIETVNFSVAPNTWVQIHATKEP